MCYFQRCQNIETIGWVCNYHGIGVEVECNQDEVCFEETHPPATTKEWPLLFERSCRSTVTVNGNVFYLKPWIDKIFPEGGIYGQKHLDGRFTSVSNSDLCNGQFDLPASFQIAANSKSSL